MPAAGVSERDTGRLDELAGSCQTTTFDDGDGTGTVGCSRRAVAGGFALSARVSSGDGVVMVGVAQGDLDRSEFIRLVRAANDRVSANL